MPLFHLRTAPPCARAVLSSPFRPQTQQFARRSLQTAAASPATDRSHHQTTTKASRPLAHPKFPLPTKTPEELKSSPYIVSRTPFAQLPVYRKWHAGGNLQKVRIKKVTGDRQKLVQELVEKLGVDPTDVRINPTTQHIEVKGAYYEKVRDYLLESGF